MAANMLRMITGGKKKTINLTTDLGLQMLNGIPEDIDEEEFIEHARMEWIEVSHNVSVLSRSALITATFNGPPLPPPPTPTHNTPTQHVLPVSSMSPVLEESPPLLTNLPHS